MRTTELKAMIATAEQLGHTDIKIMRDDSRDGETIYTEATIRFALTGKSFDNPEAILLFS